MARIIKGIIGGFSERAGALAGANRYGRGITATTQSGSVIRMARQENSAQGTASAAAMRCATAKTQYV